MTSRLETLPPSRRRFLALALLLLAFLTLHFLLVEPYLHLWRKQRSEIQALLRQRQRLRGQMAQFSYWKAQENKLANALGQRPLYFSAPTQAVAAAALQERLRKMVEESGGEVLSIQTLQPSPEEETLSKIGVSLRLRLTTSALFQLLNRIERASPILLIEQLDISPGRGYYDQTERRYKPLDRLQVTLALSAFFRREAP